MCQSLATAHSLLSPHLFFLEERASTCVSTTIRALRSSAWFPLTMEGRREERMGASTPLLLSPSRTVDVVHLYLMLTPSGSPTPNQPRGMTGHTGLIS